ncbi:MAG: hypothetical protein U0640_11865 [Phycisphaerales bacterium]
MDRYKLLCEDCGYSIEGLEDESKCPECGTSVASSLPAARPGTLWQHKSSLTNWCRTNWNALRHPKHMFRTMKIDKGSSNSLLAINILIASFFIADPWVGVLIFDPARGARLQGPVIEVAMQGGMLLFWMCVTSLFLLGLTWIECRGVRFFSNRRGWRMTPEAAWQICCHASIGWIIMALLPLLGMAAMVALVRVFHYSPTGVIDLTRWLGPGAPTWHVEAVVRNTLTLGAGLAGLMVFESLVYIGARQCKYAATIPASHPASAHSDGQTRGTASATES